MEKVYNYENDFELRRSYVCLSDLKTKSDLEKLGLGAFSLFEVRNAFEKLKYNSKYSRVVVVGHPFKPAFRRHVYFVSKLALYRYVVKDL